MKLCLAFLLALAIPALAAAQLSAEEHAGKPIIRPSITAATTQTAIIPQQSFDFDSGRVALALIGVISLILLLRYWGKQLFPTAAAGGRSQAVRVLARCPLAPRQQVILIQVGRRIVVAAESASQMSSLCQISDPDEVAALLGQIQRDRAGPISSPFTAWFSRASDAFTAEDKDLAEPTDQNIDLPPNPAEPPDSPIRSEIRGLSEKVRQLTRQLGGSRTHQ